MSRPWRERVIPALTCLAVAGCTSPVKVSIVEAVVTDCYDLRATVAVTGGRRGQEVTIDVSLDGSPVRRQAIRSGESEEVALEDVPAGSHVLRVEGAESEGNPADEWDFETAGTRPQVEITGPDSASYTELDTVVFTALVSDAEDDSASLAVEWSSNLDGLLNRTPPDAAGNVRFETSSLTPGEHDISLLVTDTCGDRTTGFVPLTIEACLDEDLDGVTTCGGDCHDDDASVLGPGAPEGVDTNGDGILEGDGRDNDCDGTTDEGTDRYDDDGDGWTELTGDCDDSDPLVHPLAGDPPNLVDDDCDGLTDEGLDVDDDDGDGFSEEQGDCDDTDDTRYPDAPEPGDGIDHNCDGLAGAPESDDDGDGWSEQDGDCNDGDARVHPEASEVAYDGIDQDCDGADLVDVDGDHVAAVLAGGEDCNDLDPSVRPGAPEICDGVDQNCDGTVDFFEDLDGDGYSSCDPEAPELVDCDDGNARTHPGAEERFDCIDNNCNGEVDEGSFGRGDDHEPNESTSEATGLGTIDSASRTVADANIHASTDEDWYSFYSEDDFWDWWYIGVTLTDIPAGANYDVELYDSSGRLRGGSYNPGSSEENIRDEGTAGGEDSGTYYVRVFSADGSFRCRSYALIISAG